MLCRLRRLPLLVKGQTNPTTIWSVSMPCWSDGCRTLAAYTSPAKSFWKTVGGGKIPMKSHWQVSLRSSLCGFSQPWSKCLQCVLRVRVANEHGYSQRLCGQNSGISQRGNRR